MKELEDDQKKNLNENINSKTEYDDSGNFSDFQSVKENEEVLEGVAKGEKSAKDLARNMTENDILSVALNNSLYKTMLAPCLAANVRLNSRLFELIQGPQKESDFESVVNEALNKLQVIISNEPNGLVFVNGKLDPGASVKQAASNNLGLNPLFADTERSDYYQRIYDNSLSQSNIFVSRVQEINDSIDKTFLADYFAESFGMARHDYFDFKAATGLVDDLAKLDFGKILDYSLGDKKASKVGTIDMVNYGSAAATMFMMAMAGVEDDELARNLGQDLNEAYSEDAQKMDDFRRIENEKALKGNSEVFNSFYKAILGRSVDEINETIYSNKGYNPKKPSGIMGERKKLAAYKDILANICLFENSGLRMSKANQDLFSLYKKRCVEFLGLVNPDALDENGNIKIEEILKDYNVTADRVNEDNEKQGSLFRVKHLDENDPELALETMAGRKLKKAREDFKEIESQLSMEEYYDSNKFMEGYLFTGSEKEITIKTMMLREVLETEYGKRTYLLNFLAGVDTLSDEELEDVNNQISRNHEGYRNKASKEVKRKIRSDTIRKMEEYEEKGFENLDVKEKKDYFNRALFLYKGVHTDRGTSEHDSQLNDKIIGIFERFSPDLVKDGRLDQDKMFEFYQENLLDDAERKSYATVSSLFNQVTEEYTKKAIQSVIEESKGFVRSRQKEKAEELGMTVEEYTKSLREKINENSARRKQEAKEKSGQAPSITEEEAEPAVEKRSEPLVVDNPNELDEKKSDDKTPGTQPSITEEEAKPVVAEKSENMIVTDPKVASRAEDDEKTDSSLRVETIEESSEMKDVGNVEKQTAMTVTNENFFTKLVGGIKSRFSKIKDMFKKPEIVTGIENDDGSKPSETTSSSESKNNQDVFQVLQGEALNEYQANTRHEPDNSEKPVKEVKTTNDSQEIDM